MSASIEEKPDGAPEWMVSYADMITIMMSFFVVMFALSSKKDETAKKAAVASLEYRFSPAWRPFGQIGPGLYPRGSAQKKSGDKKGRGRGLGNSPGGELDEPGRDPILRGRLRVPGRGNRLDVGGVVHFDEFSDSLAQEQIDKLRAIADELAGKPQRVEVLGHASKRPMPPGASHHDHWDLAYARCRRVTEQLVAMGVDPKRVRMGVAGSNEPAYTGMAPEMLKENSRVDVYLLDTLSDEAEAPDGNAAR